MNSKPLSFIERVAVCTILILLLSLIRTVACAEDQPFELRCPDLLQCSKNAPGQWVPNWWVKDVAADMARLEGAQEELEHMRQEISAFQVVNHEYAEKSETAEQLVVQYELMMVAKDERIKAQDRKLARRLRWTLSFAGVLLLGVAGIGVYAAH